MKIVSCGPCVRSKGVLFGAKVISDANIDCELDWYGITIDGLHDRKIYEELSTLDVIKKKRMRLFSWSDNFLYQISKYDCYVNFSIEFDSLPTIIMEAITQNVIPICGDLGGGKEIIPKALTNRLVYTTGDVSDCLSRIKLLHETDYNYRAEMLEELRKCQQEKFNFYKQNDILWNSLIE